YIKSHILLSLILFHILLVGAFPSLSDSMVKILARLGSMLANISCNWEKRVLMMLCGFACFLYPSPGPLSLGLYAAEFIWPSKDKPSTCPSLKPIQKNLLLMFLSAIEFLMNCLSMEIFIYLMLY